MINFYQGDCKGRKKGSKEVSVSAHDISVALYIVI